MTQSPRATAAAATGRRTGRFWVSFWVAAAGSILSFVYELFTWPLQEQIDEIGMVLLFMVLSLVFALSAIWSIAHLGLYIRRRRFLALVPLLLALLSLWSFTMGTIRTAWRTADDYLHRGQRQAVVAMIESGGLEPLLDSTGRPAFEGRVADSAYSASYRLPLRYRHLSVRGLVGVYEREGARHVVFLATPGMFGAFTGYIYRSDDDFPRPPERGIRSRFPEAERLGDHWYFVNFH